MHEVEVRPATSWPDVAAVLGPNGGSSGCWCLWFRVPGGEFRELGGDERRDRLRSLVESGTPTAAPGLLAYADGTPVGWCAVAPREEYTRLARSPITRPADRDETGVWAVTCFYVTRAGRGRGVAAALLEAAVDHAAGQGAVAVEGYPVDSGRRLAAGELYHGWRSLFEDAGFTEVARRSPSRPVMRRPLPGPS
ncbi:MULTISPECIES: GNAT family N-acetyltransferase [unclassified Nonomuraea]|uniref:GNAT family N-acetyltransferase n=1 Tax=unclassified Nonomuraea TaxID=2593643 RepID=UPI0033EB6B37